MRIYASIKEGEKEPETGPKMSRNDNNFPSEILPFQSFDPGEFVVRTIQNDPTLQPSTKHQSMKAIENYLVTGGSATPDTIATIQAAVFRTQTLQNAIKIWQPKGEKAHTWLSYHEAEQLLEACNSRSSGKKEFEIIALRDRLAICLMMAAGLRREEGASIQFTDIIKRDKRSVLNVTGKGAKSRAVPISDRLAEANIDWQFLIDAEGLILRSLGRNKEPKDSISTTGLYNIVQKRGSMTGKPDLQPHDLRRTYAELGRRAGVPISQISKLLGHASIETTQEFLNITLDLETTISDFVPF